LPLCEWQANEKAKTELEIEIRKLFKEHNLGNIALRPLQVEEERFFVQRIEQRYAELNKDYIQLKVRRARLLSCNVSGEHVL